MKMVEVITGLRTLTPDLRTHVDELLASVREANNLSSDAGNCVSREALRALMLPLSAALSHIACTAMSVDASSARLEALVNGYTRQFKDGPADPAAAASSDDAEQADDPRQLNLPGFDEPAVVREIADAAAKAVMAVDDEDDPED